MRFMKMMFAAGLAVGSMSAQAPRAATTSGDARVVRVIEGQAGGMCCLNLTTIDQSSMVWERKDFPNPKTFPNRKQKRAITKEEWESLVQSIDAKALQAVPQENGCRGCIDLPDAWLVVEYSDGSKISVHYDPAARRPVPVEKLKFPRIQIILYP